MWTEAATGETSSNLLLRTQLSTGAKDEAAVMAEPVSHPSELSNAQLFKGWPNHTVPGEVFHKHLPYQVPGCNKHLEQPNPCLKAALKHSRDEARTAKLLEA